MPKKVTDQDRLSEMLTLVITPSVRARIQDASRKRGNLPYAYLVRQAIQEWLDKNEPLTEAEISQLTIQWIIDNPPRGKE